MKSYRYLLLLAVFAVCLNACKKSSKPTGTGTTTTKLKYLVQTIIVETGPAALGSPVSTSNVYYTYDSKKRLSTIKLSDNSVQIYAYNDNSDLFSITNNDASGAMTAYTEFTYDGGKLQSYKYQQYLNNAVKNEINYTCVYGGNKLTEIHFDVNYLKFTYDSNGNITRTYSYGDPSFYLVSTYDNKKSPFINSLFKYPTTATSGQFSPNNQITGTTEGLNVNILTTYKYNYDSDGYPIAGTSSSDIANASSYKSTYIYSTLE